MKFRAFALLLLPLLSTGLAQANCRVDLVDNGYVLQSFDAYGPGELFCRDALQECHRQRLLSSLTAGAQCVATPDLNNGGFSGGGAPSVRPFPIPGPGPSFPDPRFPDPRFPDPRYPDPRFPDPHYPGPHHPGPHYPGPNYPGPNFPGPNFPDPGFPGSAIQVGETVFPYAWDHVQGGVVLAFSPYNRDYRVRSNRSGDVYTFTERELGLGRGCLEQNNSLGMRFCVGEQVFPESWDHALGGVILAIYPSHGQLLVKSGRSGDVYKFSPDTLAVASGCLDYYCVGQTVYPRTWNHSQGGRVIAINLAKRQYTVVSNRSGDVYKFSAYEL